MKIKDNELKAILSEVQTELDQLFKSEKLSKAVGDDEPTPEATPEASAASPEGSAPAPEASAPPAPVASPAAPNAPADMTPGDTMPHDAPAESAEGTPGEIEATTDPEALKAEYMKLAPEELKMHYLAAKQALIEAMGGGQEAPAPAPEAPMAPPATPAPEMTMKGEKDYAKANGGEMSKGKMAKSEPNEEVELLKGQIENQNKQIEMLVKAVDLTLSQPLRKAVTSVAHLPKTENLPTDVTKLTKAQIDLKLKPVITQNLSKSDRQLINQYYTDAVKVDAIAHLLK